MQGLPENPLLVLKPAGRGESDRAEQIVAATCELLDEGGLGGLTIRAVLARTGLARRAFYECFSGKDDLVLAVFETMLMAAAGHYDALARQIGDPLETIREIAQGIVLGRYGLEQDPGEFIDRRSAAMAREHLRLAETRPDELQAALRPLLDLIAEQVRSGIRAGQLREADPDLQARLIYNLVATTAHTELIAEDTTGSDRENRQRLAEDLWEFCRRAIIA
ncbi:MAG: TetR/AcrR family transcriptional regulator [Novosphingobium sp.]|nr:TetR/AcrR family transcriptional regulator [Novosphingobium sp.]